MPEPNDERLKPIPAAWVGVDEVGTEFSNMFVVQFTPAGEFTLSFGEMVQPMLTGRSETQQLEELRRIPFIPIRTVARISLNEVRVQELADILSRIVVQYRERGKR